MENRKICCRCKMNLTTDRYFKKRDDTFRKTCNECLAQQRAYVEKNKCPHGKQKNRCRDCEDGGASFCIHNKIRSRCHECNGGEMCSHGRERRQCKLCSDPVKVVVKTMIGGSKRKDKIYNRYDAVNFIDPAFVESMIEENPRCYYKDCNKELQLINYQDDLATIERLDNSIGHTKSNCVICCLKCNCSKRSNKL